MSEPIKDLSLERFEEAYEGVQQVVLPTNLIKTFRLLIV